MNIKSILTEGGIKPRKEWDQFFLQNDNIIDKEVQLAELKDDDIVLEIGSGPGNLTERIAEKAKVIAVERDRRFVSLLKRIENVQVVCGNAVKLIKDLEFNKVVSNIPYSVSKKLVLELFKKKWEIAVLIVQKEFAQKLMGGSKLSLLVKDCADLKVVGMVAAGEFYPPAVDSSLIILRQKRLMDEKFWLFLNEIYRQKNKNTGNVVRNCADELRKKKVQHLGLEDVRQLYQMNKD